MIVKLMAGNQKTVYMHVGVVVSVGIYEDGGSDADRIHVKATNYATKIKAVEHPRAL